MGALERLQQVKHLLRLNSLQRQAVANLRATLEMEGRFLERLAKANEAALEGLHRTLTRAQAIL